MKNYQQRSINQDQKEQVKAIPSVQDYMVKKLITFTPDTPIMNVIETLLKNRITGAPVLSKTGELLGLIDDKDCLNVLTVGAYYNHIVERETVQDYMSSVMKTISIDSSVMDCAHLFLQTPYKRLLVLNHAGKLVGQISRRDVLRAIKEL